MNTNFEFYTNARINYHINEFKDNHVLNLFVKYRKSLAGKAYNIQIYYLHCFETSISDYEEKKLLLNNGGLGNEDIIINTNDGIKPKLANAKTISFFKESIHNQLLMKQKLRRFDKIAVFPPYYERCIINFPKKCKYKKSFKKWWYEKGYDKVFMHTYVPINKAKLEHNKSIDGNIDYEKKDIISFLYDYYKAENFIIELERVHGYGLICKVK